MHGGKTCGSLPNLSRKVTVSSGYRVSSGAVIPGLLSFRKPVGANYFVFMN